MTPRFTHLAMIGALAAVFALAGCGRKGPLEPPPGPASETAPAAKPASARAGFGSVAGQDKAGQPPSFNSQGKPVPIGPGPKRALPMDWLID